MKIAISGITGLIGSSLSEHFKRQGHEVVGLYRRDFEKGESHLAQKLQECRVVVNLAGVPILKRWSVAWKENIYTSRVNTTSKIIGAFNKMRICPHTFVSASAVGIYDTQNVHDEYSTSYSEGFLGKVCKDWEEEALKATRLGIRVCLTRYGVVLSNKGGALKKMILPFKLGLGGKIGNGLQPMPFIHIEDAVSAVEWLLMNEQQEGIFNMVAPQIISNKDFTKALSGILHRPALMTVPAWGLRMVYGEGVEVLTEGQKVVCRRLQEGGFQFSYADIKSALMDLIS